MRWDIINHLTKKNNYTSYLEIGYYKGWSFDRVECQGKTAVDPNPCKTPYQEAASEGEQIIVDVNPSYVIFKTTSDRFFANITDSSKWDIIFIDGLHESQQVSKDIVNALKHLNPGGTIVMHDCNPSSEVMSTTGTAGGEWTGDVFKSFISFRSNGMRESYVVDTDYGVGIIKDNPPYPSMKRASTDEVIDNFENTLLYSGSFKDFDTQRQLWLGLITPEQFIEREKA